MTGLVLSLFPGIGLLDRAFEEAGFCVVRGPDVLWGGDVHRFHPPPGVFDGVIGGPPCQAFSRMGNIARARGYQTKPNLIPEFERCVAEAAPEWFLMENVSAAPEPTVQGYVVRSLRFNNRWLGEEQNRERMFRFGTRDGRVLLPDVAIFDSPVFEPAVMAGAGKAINIKIGGAGKVKSTWVVERKPRPFSECLRLQGLPEDFLEDAPFTASGKQRVVGNGVPLPMGRAIAQAVKRAVTTPAAREAGGW